MRRRLSLLFGLRATRPRLLPFLPILLRAALRRRTPDAEPQLPRRPTEVGAAAMQTPRSPADLVVFSVIRNGISNGYPFVEAYGSWLGHADRIVVVDGGSDDGTRQVLDELAAIDDGLVVEAATWPATDTAGAAIAELTTTALERARLSARRLMYVQADEIYTDEQRALITGHTGPSALRFAGCVNFWNSFDTVLENEFPMRYVRVFPADSPVRSLADGFSFDVGDLSIDETPELFLHYGWCFPVNILRKHVNHGSLYSDDPGYRLRGRLAKLMLEQGRYDRRLLDALAPQYRPTPFRGEHPMCMRHVVTQERYDPRPGLELLRSGVRW
jgi:hypothetical protein